MLATLTVARKSFSRLLKYIPITLFLANCQHSPDAPVPTETYAEGEQVPGTEVKFPLQFYDGTTADPVASPDGQTIVYRRWLNDGSTPSGLYAIPLGGGPPHLVVAGPKVSDAQFSPDGRWLAFNDEGQIHKIHPDGTARTLLAGPRSYPDSANHTAYVGNCFSPLWHPDGQQLAYSFNIDYRSGQAGLWVMKADGTQAQRVCDTGALAWHPAGNALLRAESVATVPTTWTRFALFQLADCGIVQHLNTPTGTDNRGVSYSPDGTRLLYYNERGIYVMNADGTQRRRLLPNQLVYNPTNNPVSLLTQAPHWLPDGQAIVYEHFRITRVVEPTPGAITASGTLVEGTFSLYRLNLTQALATSTLP